MILTELNKTSLALIKDQWLSSATITSHEVFLADYEQLFDVIESDEGYGPLDGRLNKHIYYAVGSDNGKTKALVQIVQSKRGSDVWVKMTDLYMSPEIEGNNDTEASTVERLEVFSKALTGVFSLTGGRIQADTVKVYGRTDALVTFLRGMHDSFAVISSLGNLPGIKVTIEGRWLVFQSGR